MTEIVSEDDDDGDDDIKQTGRKSHEESVNEVSSF